MKQDAILAINPGTTTTRCALYAVGGDTLTPIAEQVLDHDETHMAGFAGIPEQLPFRTACVADFMAPHSDRITLIATAGRGGMLTPVPAGVIRVTDDLVWTALHAPVHQHASNLGAPLAHAIAQRHGIPAFIVDPVSVDQFSDIARISGVAELPRFSFVHALNIRACARRLARDLNKPVDDLTAVIAHLGAGFSIAAFQKGRIVDNSNRMECAPFTPERAGGVPPMSLIDLCYSGRFTPEGLKRHLYGNGGLQALLGTKDVRKVEAMIDTGDIRATLIYDAMIYQIAKAVGAMASVSGFRVDAIVLTGGLANSTRLTAALVAKLSRLGPVHIYPGSNECLALAQGAADVLSGVATARHWPVMSPLRQAV